MLKKTLLILFFVIFSFNSFAEDEAIPQFFMSTRSDSTKLRTGPGDDYPIKLKYQVRGIPVQVVSSYDNWYKIQDYEGEKGWIHQLSLSKIRTVLITQNDTIIYFSKSEKSRPVAKVEKNAIMRVLKCGGDWCKVEDSSYKGWLKKENIWGV